MNREKILGRQEESIMDGLEFLAIAALRDGESVVAEEILKTLHIVDAIYQGENTDAVRRQD